MMMMLSVMMMTQNVTLEVLNRGAFSLPLGLIQPPNTPVCDSQLWVK